MGAHGDGKSTSSTIIPKVVLYIIFMFSEFLGYMFETLKE